MESMYVGGAVALLVIIIILKIAVVVPIGALRNGGE